MFGFSFSEVVLIGVVTLIAVGPQRLPSMLNNLGVWIRRLRNMTVEVRKQTGIDEILRAEGLHGGLNELRTLMRGGGGFMPPGPSAPQVRRPIDDPYRSVDIDVIREYPPDGPDSLGALPDDLVPSSDEPVVSSGEAPLAKQEPPAAP